jgi:hypothetical protein
MLRILAFFRIIDLVWLEDHEGEVYLTIKRKSPFVGYWCRVYPISCVGHVILNDNGTCKGDSSYIKRWKNYRE